MKPKQRRQLKKSEELNDMQYIVLCVLQDHKSQEQISVYGVGFNNNNENVSSHL